MEARDPRAELFLDEASGTLDEIEQVVKDMKLEGICYTDDIRRLADELDEIWDNVSTKADSVEEEEELDEEPETE